MGFGFLNKLRDVNPSHFVALYLFIFILVRGDGADLWSFTVELGAGIWDVGVEVVADMQTSEPGTVS